MEPLVKYWMNAVTKGTGGTVEFEYYPSEQLGKAKDMLSLALSATVGAEWADALDKRGKPGSEVLKAFTEALTAVR